MTTDPSEAQRQQTPIPWHASNRGIGWEIHAGREPAEGCWGDRSDYCREVNDGFRDTFTEADARFTARAANSHAALVEALIGLRDITRVVHANGTVSPQLRDEAFLRNLRADAALALAEGETA